MNSGNHGPGRRKQQVEWMRGQYADSSGLRTRAALHDRFGTGQGSWFRWLFDHYTFPPSARILEVGCGPGDLWHRNRDRLADHWRILLTDLSSGMVREARELLRGLPQVAYAVADVQHLPVGDGTVDAVIANQMLSHAPDPVEAVGELRRVLTPSGRLYAGTNGRAHMGEIFTLLRAFDPQLPRHAPRDPSFALEEITAQLAPRFAGIRVERLESTLRVTEAEPLVAYVYSMPGLWAPPADRRDALRRFVDDRLRPTGAISVTRITGIVTAAPRRV